MTSQPDERPFSESNLESPEYRARLQRKLNCLIAVLEVACAKVRRSLTGPDADTERLTRIQKNLQDTLNVCQRAKRALERAQAEAEVRGILSRELQRLGEDLRCALVLRFEEGMTFAAVGEARRVDGDRRRTARRRGQRRL